MVPTDHKDLGSKQIGVASEAAPEMDLGDFGILSAEVPAARDGTAPALDGLLSEVLFGEIIDISDLVPLVLSSAADTANSEVLSATSTEFRPPDNGDVLLVSGQSAMSILYDDGILSAENVVL
jgi:hypothetical protein